MEQTPRTPRRHALAAFACLLLALPANGHETKPTPQLPADGKPAPLFTLKDVNARPRRLTEWRGRPVVLFFFCGCTWCAEVAKEWATLQRGDPQFTAPDPQNAKPARPVTILIYQGNAEEVRNLATSSGMDLSQTILLPDPDRKITESLYHADPCPRVIVLDSKGIIRYINRGPDDKPREAPAALIIAKTLRALRDLPASTNPKP